MLKVTSLGYELELGDVSRKLVIPEKFGEWEYAETDIVNLHYPYKYVATDPLGEDPPMGGEINIKPGYTVDEVAERVSNTIHWFTEAGMMPTASCVNHGHVHVRVKGLRDDVEALRRVTAWIRKNQQVVIARAYKYKEHADMSKAKTAKTYLKWDGGRPMPDWMARNIETQAKSFNDFIKIQCCGKDGVSMGRPFRYAINTYCMKHTDTIELRCLRASTNPIHIRDSIRFAKDLVEIALVDGCSAEELFTFGGYNLPPFYYDSGEYLGWERTKYSKERGHKVRKLYDI